MKKIYLSLVATLVALTSLAQGWPSNYSGVMLQGFYWDSYDVTNWQKFIDRSDELTGAFDLIWVPNSATVQGGGESMGYMPFAWLRHTSRFGTEAKLLEMVDLFRSKNTGFIEDVVLNHKAASAAEDGTYRKFYVESKDGYVLDWDNVNFTGIVSNDDVPGGGNPDTGDGFDGARDLDHTNALVQKNCITYQQFLMQWVGYVGFRLDMVKGYDGKYNGMYNAASGPAFCVGEYWDGFDAITGWMNRTSANGAIQSGAFDFPFKYAINDAFANGDWNKLTTDGVILNEYWRRYAVTFVDNHDTRREDFNTLTKNIEDANILILALPGTPCVLIQDFDDYKENITKMIAIRRAVGVLNTSAMEVIPWDNNKGCQFFVTGKYGHLRIDLGDAVNLGTPEGMKLALSTKLTRVYVDEAIDLESGKKEPMVFGQPFFSVPSGVYSEPFTVRVGPSVRGATFVYTTDGTDPTPKSKKLDKVTELTIDKSTTIIGGILVDGAVTRVVKQDYIISSNVPENITVYVKAASAPYLYAWDDNGQLNGDWPGKAMTETATVGGITWYKQSFKKNGEGYQMNAIFNTGNDGVQTGDLTGIGSDVFYVFTPGETSASAKDVTALYLNALYNPTVSIDKAGGEYAGAFTANVVASNPDATIVYTLNGNDPTPTSGTKATGKAAVSIPANATTTLKAGVLLDGTVQNIVSATYVTKNGTVESGINVYVMANEAPYLYTWNADGQANGDWPGKQMTEKRTVQGKSFYYQHFNATNLNIIFNCGTGGEGNQTKDINGLGEGDHYYTYDGGGNYEDVTSQYGGSTSTTLPACAKWVDGSWFVYFENNAGYADPHIWCWGDDYAQFTGTDWPGTALVAQVGMSANGNPVYRWTYGNKTLTPTGLVFSDAGSPQTSDFVFVNGGYYNANGLVGTVKDTGIEEIANTVNKDVKSVRYYNLMGVPSNKPYEGLNIIVTTYSDGSTSAVKQLR